MVDAIKAGYCLDVVRQLAGIPSQVDIALLHTTMWIMTMLCAHQARSAVPRLYQIVANTAFCKGDRASPCMLNALYAQNSSSRKLVLCMERNVLVVLPVC